MYTTASQSSDHETLANQPRGRIRSASEVPIPVHNEPRQPESVHLPRSASYTYFPQVKDYLEDPAVIELKGTISEDDLKARSFISADDTSHTSSGGSTPEVEEPPPVERPPLRRKGSRRSSRFLSFTNKSQDFAEDSKSEKTGVAGRKSADISTSRSPVRSLTMLRRKSWISTSRGSSPTREAEKPAKAEKPKKNGTSEDAKRRKSLNVAVTIPEQAGGGNGTESPSTLNRRQVLTKKPKRPLSALLKSSTVIPEPAEPMPPTPKSPSFSLLQQSFSTDKLPSFAQSPTSPTRMPPMPRNFSTEKLKVKTEPRKKDELWTVFRTLEGDLRKFQAKSISLKANVLRTTLLPFLRSYAVHPSNHKLRPEDLDRRVNILNGWWTGLLELLAGRNNQSISGTDRPAILEAIAGVMERPEWRHSSSPFCPLADRADSSSTKTSNSTTSLSSGSSDFLADSVYHNVRNIFVQNLLSQMAFVVDKMSLRNAAASLVTFCGKTCAYVFCFCPGIADVLVRLWEPSMGTMRRVLENSGISRQDRLDTISDHIVPAFPPNLHGLKFHSLVKIVRSLRKPAVPPLGSANLDWYGPWVKRWSGAESDMFYVFVKHYHILAADFLPPGSTHAERICIPGLLMVHAQILRNLDETINRNANPQQQEEPSSGAASITFDDVLGEPDAQASALPLPPMNATRQMAENRLIMLIRDFLSERNSHVSVARQLFAEGFGRLLKAAARKVSIYDSNACYTLCDFLEEAFFILVRYEQAAAQSQSVLEWSFWLSVCKKMTASENTSTEIKLYSFLYSIWPTLALDESRKASLCLDFLLEPEFFESRFNHWCPMVRSYFMRLICWRVARYDGEETAGELDIMRALSNRLRSVWSHYLWIREDTELKRSHPPLTTPCNPAPGRRFLIIRNDTPIVAGGGPFLSFDGVVQSPTAKRLSSIGAVTESDIRPVSAQSTDSSDFGQPEQEPGKKRWSILRTLIGTPKSSSKLRSSGPTPKEPTQKASTSPPPANPPSNPPKAKASATEERPALPTHRSFSFRFSLEWVDKRFQNPQNMRLAPPRLPLPAQVLLQSHGINISPMNRCRPLGLSTTVSRYAGRSLAEWTIIVHECQNFFDRRKHEGVPSDKLVETPSLNVEAFRRPG